MPNRSSRAVLPLTYAVLVFFGAIVAVPDPTMIGAMVVAIVGLLVIGFALVDGSLRQLSWGIGSFYGVALAITVGIEVADSVREDPLLASEAAGPVTTASMVLSICALIGGFLLARQRGGAH